MRGFAKTLNYLAIAAVSILPLQATLMIKQAGRIYLPHFEKIGMSESLPSITRSLIQYSQSPWAMLLGLLLAITSAITLTLMMRSERARPYLPFAIMIFVTIAFTQLAAGFIACALPLLISPAS
ncbi:MAG: hypothetical protein L3J39_17385 [Verrucomicrobiales bacterium]|nr:hypothetical protein [Verrucomicrobiales bacterium]